MQANYTGIDNNKADRFLRHSDCDIVNGQYGYYKWIKEKKREFVPCGSAVEVKEVLINLETMKRKLRLETYDYTGRGTEIDMPRSAMTEQGILCLTDYGVQVDKKSAGVLLKCLENEEINAPQTYEHSKLGFSLYDKELIFKGHKALGIESKYVGEIDIQPRGSYKKWKKMIQEEVLGTPLEIVLAGALSAPVLDFICKDYPTDNIIMSLAGDSSSGKTTALVLAVSVGGNPALSGKSHMLSFIDTELSIVHKLSSSFPTGIDEFTAINNKNIKNLLYTIANGSERGRMNKNAELRETNEFHTSVFMSGEHSILSSVGEYGGLVARVMEFSGIKWTSSGASADTIKKICLSNHGWAVRRMAKYLMEVEKESLVCLCEEYTEDFLKNQKNKNSLAERMAKRVGIILATAQIAEEIFEFEFDLEMMEEFFHENLKFNSEDYDVGIIAYDAVISYVTERPTEFGETINNGTLQTEDIYYKNGKIMDATPVTLYDGTISKEEVFIKKDTFERILLSKGINDSRSVLERLESLGLLIRSEKDRVQSRMRIGVDEFLVKGYRLRIRNSEKQE